MNYRINEVDATEEFLTIWNFNQMEPDWPPLEDRHIKNGYWWLIHTDFGFGRPIGFAGMVEFTPFCNVGYLKRCYILPEHRGGLQIRTIQVREEKARRIGWKQLVTESVSPQSTKNFLKCGYSLCDPEQKWGDPTSSYLTKNL